MAQYEEIKRKHFRFPAYSDEAGVKLESNREGSSFSNDESWIITEESGQAPTRREDKGEDRTLRRSHRVSQEKAGQSIKQREELKKHRKNLPDYTKRYRPEVTSTGKKHLFGEAAPQSTFKVKEKRSEPVAPQRKKGEFTRSYFVPKYIPASMIPDEPTDKVEKQALESAMAKDSYLLFDTEPSAFQERKDTDPAVSKFKQPNSEVSMTRSQYRRTSKKEKKRSVLDQSLEGLIQDETFESESKGYFKK